MTTREQRQTRWLVHGLGVGAGIAVTLIAYVSWLTPLVERVDANRMRVEQLQQMLTQADQTRSELTALQTELKGLEANIHGLKARIPDEPEDAIFLDAISQQAKKLGLRLVDYRRFSSIERPTHSEVEVNVKCLGDFGALCQLLAYVEALPRQTTIRELVIHSLAEHRVYPMEVTFVLFFNLKQPTEPRA